MVVGDDDDGNDEQELPGELVDRSQLADRVFAAFKVMTCPPTAFGMGHTSIQDKAAALLYTLFLESGWSNLASVLNSFLSFTTDMGTELQLNDFASIDFNKLLPRHVVNGKMETDGDDEVSTDLPWFFRCSLPVSGVLHTISNATKDLNKALKGWDKFYNDLKVLERLLCYPMRVQRLVAVCLRGTAFEPCAFLFHKHMHGLYDKRWGEVSKFCFQLDSRLSVLRGAWNEQVFNEGYADDGAGGDGDDNRKFQPVEVSRVLRDFCFLHTSRW